MADSTPKPPAEPKKKLEKLDMNLKGKDGVWEQATESRLFADIGNDKLLTFKVGDGDAAVEHKMSFTQVKEKLSELKTRIETEKLTGDALKPVQEELDAFTKASNRLMQKTGGVGKEKFEQFGRLSFTNKVGARVAGNWGKEWTIGRGVRIFTTALGAILIGKGIKDMVAPDRDEKGENQTGFFVPIVEVAAGATGIYMAALHRGAHKAMNLHL